MRNAESGRVADIKGRIGEYLENELIPLEKYEGLTMDGPVAKDILKSVWKRSRELGFYGIHLPEEFGGQNLTIEELCHLKEFLAASESILFLHVLGEMGGPLRVGDIIQSATPDQMERFFLPVIRGEKASCFALTEPTAGSDAGAIRTRAIRDGDHYVMNGQKHYITAATIADFAIVMAVTDSHKGPGRVTAFLVESDRPGYSLSEPMIPMSGGGYDAGISLNDCRVPASNVLGREGMGFKLGMARISVNRLLHCPSMIGMAQRVLDMSIHHAKTREQFGRPIAEFQAIQHMLADMATGVFAARCMILEAARKADRGEDIRKESSMCKVFCSETAFKVADSAVQVHGNVGVTQGHPVEVIFRNLRIYRIVTGTSEIQRNTIAKAL